MAAHDFHKVRDQFNSGDRYQFMLTFKDHQPIVDTDKYTISVWNDELNAYEVHSFEFIEVLYELICEAKTKALVARRDSEKSDVVVNDWMSQSRYPKEIVIGKRI